MTVEHQRIESIYRTVFLLSLHTESRQGDSRRVGALAQFIRSDGKQSVLHTEAPSAVGQNDRESLGETAFRQEEALAESYAAAIIRTEYHDIVAPYGKHPFAERHYRYGNIGRQSTLLIEMAEG